MLSLASSLPLFFPSVAAQLRVLSRFPPFLRVTNLESLVAKYVVLISISTSETIPLLFQLVQ